VSYLFQNPSDQIFCENVFKEVAHTARTNEDAQLALSILTLSSIGERNPLEIPLPLQRMVTLASTFAMRSPVILLDEPTAFLDDQLSLIVVSAIKKYQDAGHTFIIVSHDYLLKEGLKSRTIVLQNGSVIVSNEDKRFKVN
jgi:energy-coupling factor transport system ATP-binding protein